MTPAVKYTGTFSDHSGYGSANRAFITALYTAGVDVTTELIVQVKEFSDNGWSGKLAMDLVDREIPYKAKIIHLTPDMYPRYIETDKYNIGHLFWETDRLPREWVEPCNKMQEIWTSSESMAEVFKKCGVRVPIFAFPQPIDISKADKPYHKFNIPHHKGFLFYAIFQWIERKNPKGLLQAYWEAFSGREDVSLLLKTYRIDYSAHEYEKIQLDIERWKQEFGLPHYPRVYLTTKLLSHEDIMRVHETGDCYLAADHGEGWSRPLQEALLMANPVVASARGGIHEYLTNDMYYPIKNDYVPVVTQPWIPWYTSDQNWVQPDMKEMKDRMQFVFFNREMAQVKAEKAKSFIKDSFSYHKVGQQMRERLEKIYKAV